jgi:hypothetical protein
MSNPFAILAQTEEETAETEQQPRKFYMKNQTGRKGKAAPATQPPQSPRTSKQSQIQFGYLRPNENVGQPTNRFVWRPAEEKRPVLLTDDMFPPLK